MVFEGFFEGNEGFGKVKKWVFNLIKGILMKRKGRNMKLWVFHGKWKIENGASVEEKGGEQGVLQQYLILGFFEGFQRLFRM